VPFGTIWERISVGGGRPLISGRSRGEVEALFERRRSRYSQAAHRVNGERAVEAVAGEVLQIWSG